MKGFLVSGIAIKKNKLIVIKTIAPTNDQNIPACR